MDTPSKVHNPHPRRVGLGRHLLESFARVQGYIGSIGGLILAVLLWQVASSYKIPLWVFVAGLVVFLFAGATLVDALFRLHSSVSTVIHAKLAPASLDPSEFSRILLAQSTPLLREDMIVSIFIRSGAAERFWGFGEVVLQQEDGMLQIRTISSKEARSALTDAEASGNSEILLRPGVFRRAAGQSLEALLSLAPPKPVQPAAATTSIGPAVEKEVTSPVTLEPTETPASTPEEEKRHWFAEWRAGKTEEAERLFQENQSAQKDPIKRKRDELFFLYLKHGDGDTSALAQIETFLTDKDVAQDAHMIAGSSYNKSGNLVMARQCYAAAFELAKATRENVQFAASNLAECLDAMDSRKQAIDVLVSAIPFEPSKDAQARLLAQLGDLFKEDGSLNLACVAHAKAFERSPNGSGIGFDAAYIASSAEHQDLAIVIYQAVRQRDGKNLAVLNNLGNSYSEVGAKIAGVEAQIEAAEGGSAIANGNLASKLLDAGFVDLAMERIEAGLLLDKTNSRVNGVAGKIEKTRKAQGKMIKAAEKKGAAFQRFLNRLADSMWLASQIEPSTLEGAWSDKDGTEYLIQVSSGRSLSLSLGNSFLEKRATGELFNRGGLLLLEKKTFQLFAGTNVEWQREGHLALIYIAEGDSIEILNVGDRDRGAKALRRKVPNASKAKVLREGASSKGKATDAS